MKLQELEKLGVNVSRITRKTNLIFILSDLIESIAIEVSDELKVKYAFKQELKFDLNKILHHSRRIVSMVDKTVSETQAEYFEEDSDELKKLIYEHCNIE
jgi:hypothetical protein